MINCLNEEIKATHRANKTVLTPSNTCNITKDEKTQSTNRCGNIRPSMSISMAR
uniref:Uncharacterized protein n=1 Tax=Arion vulgaris TaxID=1028688 RepID=A0A0B6YSB2_9EUPU